MITVSIRELKRRLSEHLRMVRGGEEILVTDRAKVMAELRLPMRMPGTAAHPELVRHARAGKVRLGTPNRPNLYPCMTPSLPEGASKGLLEEQRGDR